MPPLLKTSHSVMDVQDACILIDEVGAERSNVDMIPASVQQMRIIRIGDHGRVSVRRYPRVRSPVKLARFGEVHVKSRKGTKRFAHTFGRAADLNREMGKEIRTTKPR
ncbi:MAG: hypothetical protein CM15mP18_1740 [Methanobacteriota archaeon]|nr:MAG: hypothetical protein CM15mP18_1740 [Euryarchaeota archaeon]